MRFVVLGMSEFIINCTQALLDGGAEIVLMVSLPKHKLPLNSVDISRFAKKKDIPYYETKDINSFESISTIKSYYPDYILASWPKLLKKEILKIPNKYTIGTHPTALPFNRGRHPLHWLIALGIPKNKLSFFVMDEGVDSGRLLLQVSFRFNSDETITEVVSKMNKAAYEGTLKLCKRILNNNHYQGVKQNNNLASYWRKRTPHDVILDMRMSKSMILRTVKSFTEPYPCAKLIFKNYILKIYDAKMVNDRILPKQICQKEHGKIIYVKKNIIRVKVDDGIVDLLCKRPIPKLLAKAEYIHPPSKYFEKYSDTLLISLKSA